MGIIMITNSKGYSMEGIWIFTLFGTFISSLNSFPLADVGLKFVLMFS
jgi:hypothetical protein